MILCQKTDSISLYTCIYMYMYLSSIGISVGRETPGDCSSCYNVYYIYNIHVHVHVHVQCIYTVFLSSSCRGHKAILLL